MWRRQRRAAVELRLKLWLFAQVVRGSRKKLWTKPMVSSIILL
nr:MAG TPA: hypothetical protein [Caudoviricetes sp.]